MEKLYNRIDWHNNTSPAINETNLNRMSKAVDDIDDRVVGIAGTVMETVPQIQEDLAEAQELLEDAEELTTHPPIIGQNGHWWTWDTSIDDYADSGVDAGVSLSIGETTTLPAGSDATVENVGTATDPVLNFGIPQGATGATGAGVPTGGTTGQVLAKASGTDYDTEWVNASGGSGGHTILNGSGSAMTQRSNLQFDGLNVTDDSGNDKTVVTAPTPDYVDEQYNNSTTYSKGMTCIEGNVRYRYKNSTATSGHRPPDTTYWEVLSVSDEIKNGWVSLGTTTGFHTEAQPSYGVSYPSAAHRIMAISGGTNRFEIEIPNSIIDPGASLICKPYLNYYAAFDKYITYRIDTTNHKVYAYRMNKTDGTDISDQSDISSIVTRFYCI